MHTPLSYLPFADWTGGSVFALQILLDAESGEASTQNWELGKWDSAVHFDSVNEVSKSMRFLALRVALDYNEAVLPTVYSTKLGTELSKT